MRLKFFEYKIYAMDSLDNINSVNLGEQPFPFQNWEIPRVPGNINFNQNNRMMYHSDNNMRFSAPVPINFPSNNNNSNVNNEKNENETWECNICHKMFRQKKPTA